MTSGTGSHRVYEDISSSLNDNNTLSVFIKEQSEVSHIGLTAKTAGTIVAWFSGSDGSIINANGLDAKTQSLSNGWHRISISYVADDTLAADNQFVYFSNRENTSANPGFNGTETVLMYGFQVEKLSYATSYIPTNGSTVTRLADAAFGAGSSDLINSTEGVLYAEIATLANFGTRAITLSSGSNNDAVLISFNSNGRLDVNLTSGGSFQAIFNYTGVANPNTFNKIAFKYKQDDFSLFVNGVKVATDTSGLTPIGLNVLNFAKANSAQDKFFGKTKCLAVFKEALTDAELTCLTTDAELEFLTTDETSYSSSTALAPEAVSYYYYNGDGSGLINFELNNEGLPILDNSNIKAAVNAYLDGDLDDIELWDVSNVTIMYALFQSTSFNQDISNWDTSNVTNMAFMFTRARAFNQPIGNWDVSSVSNLYRMFEEADSFNQDISSWDLTNYTGSGQDFMNGVTLSTANYDNLLISWAAKMLVAYPGGSGYNPSPSWNFGNSVHTIGGDAETAKNTLVNTFNWTITDAN